MSACRVAATKKRTFVITKETAIFSVRPIRIVGRSMAKCLRMIVSPAVANSTVQIFKYVRVIKRLEIISIEIVNVLPAFARIIYVIK